MLKKITILFILVTACVGCDQATKYTARHYLEGRATMSFMADTFRLSYAENSGAFLGLGSGMSERLRTMIFVIFVSLFLIGFLIFTLLSKESGPWILASSALILGGGFGNLIDRIVNQGAVIDFMNLGVGPLRTGIFNVADVAIMAGAFALIYIYFRQGQNQSGESA